MDMLSHDSDSESYTESSDNEDLEYIGSSFSGRAQSILLNLGQSIEKIDELLQFEREFAHGDIVCSISDPSGQMGRVVDVDMNAVLETSYGDIINEVSTKNLLRIRAFVSGDYVVLGQWLGKIDKVVDVVTVVFDDGEKCEMTTDKCDVIPISSNFVDDRQWSYYPGQRVQVKGLNIFKPTKWFCGTWNVSRGEGTICRVKEGSVHVNWIASVIPVSQTRLFVPPTLQDPKCLTLLSCFPHANWQIGDSCMLPNDYFLNHQIMKFPFDVSSQFLEEETISKSGPYVIEKMKTKVDVLWQDGSYSKGLDPRTLIPVNSIGDHDFFPDQFVLQTLSDDPHVLIRQCCGVVENVDAQERTVKVKWGTHESNSMVDSSGAQTEIVSAYELIEHPQYSYCIGEVVFRLNVPWQDHKGEISPITKMEFNSVPPLEMDPHKEKHLNEDHFGSSIGNVIGFKDGCIVVKWANGLISEVGPHEISGIDKDEEFALHNVEPVQENVNTETTDPDKQLSLKKDEDLLKTVANETAKDCRNDLWSASSLLVPREAFNFLTNIATSLFGSHGSSSSSGESSAFDGLRRNHDIIAPKIANQIEYSKIEESVVDDEKEWNSDPHFRESQDKKITISLADEKPPRFPQFDVAFDYSDHHFVKGVGKGSLSTQLRRGWLKKIQQEWSILRKDLPDTVYVRIYEERIDLLRACIVGAPQTPYHDGLFFFDISFPPDYPHEPPLVHYISGGLRLNPNLYESGKVCLSLLKTWMGSGTEVWSPENSTILQLLVSIQALVLNEKPYFNEAGFDAQIGKAEGEKNSLSYNENACLLSCTSMLYHLQNPPKHFEALVEEHFKHRAHSILSACKAYMYGAQVGHAFEEVKFNIGVHKSSSTGFKIMLKKIFPKLVSGFVRRGIDCQEFLEQANEHSVDE